ncbi:MAG: hypothetical protein ICV84_09820 [Flavisolibacter sp.]|nr:hypothetical protein [Flavisolibacter sp.]
MQRIVFILFVFLFLLPEAWTQDLNGIWKGTLTQNVGGCFPVYFIELQISIQGGESNGASYHYSDISNYVKKKFIGTYDSSLKKLSINEMGVNTFHIPKDCVPCIKNYDLWYNRSGNKETLSGDWNGKVMNTNDACQPGHIVLTRIKESAFKEVPELEVDTGTLRLDFYDNAIIDGDSISVYANNKLIVSHQRLNLQPITVYITIDLATPFQEIEMVAENLGSIPPNTALLIVTAGTKQYKLSLSSTEQKSAMVRFIYDKESAAKAKPINR